MNRRLFLSWHAVLAALVVLGFAAWMVTSGEAPGRQPGDGQAFLLATGWAALGLFSVVVTHVVRKYAHKLGVSPEFRMRAPIEALERAESALNEVRRRVLGGALSARADIHRAARDVLKRHGVHRILRIQLEPEEGAGWRVLALPTFPLGKMFHWMHAHLFYGLAGLALVGLHGGLRLEPGMGAWLTLACLVVTVTGVFGAFAWSTGPARLTDRERELSTEKAFSLDQNLDRKVAAAFEAVDPALHGELADLREPSADFGARAAAARARLASAGEVPDGVGDLLALLGQRNAVRGELRDLQRLRFRMHVWRVLHVPAAILLLFLVVLHVTTVFVY